MCAFDTISGGIKRCTLNPECCKPQHSPASLRSEDEHSEGGDQGVHDRAPLPGAQTSSAKDSSKDHQSPPKSSGTEASKGTEASNATEASNKAKATATNGSKWYPTPPEESSGSEASTHDPVATAERTTSENAANALLSLFPGFEDLKYPIFDFNDVSTYETIPYWIRNKPKQIVIGGHPERPIPGTDPSKPKCKPVPMQEVYDRDDVPRFYLSWRRPGGEKSTSEMSRAWQNKQVALNKKTKKAKEAEGNGEGSSGSKRRRVVSSNVVTTTIEDGHTGDTTVDEEEVEVQGKGKGKEKASSSSRGNKKRKVDRSNAHNREVEGSNVEVTIVEDVEEESGGVPVVMGFTAVNAYAPTAAPQPLPRPPPGLAGSGVRAQARSSSGEGKKRKSKSKNVEEEKEKSPTTTSRGRVVTVTKKLRQ